MTADLPAFREAVRAARRNAGRSQQDLAGALHLHPSVLSHKLHASGASRLSAAEVAAIIRTLRQWGALGSADESAHLRSLMGAPAPAEWSTTRPGKPGVAPTAPLPAPLTPLVGREAELTAVQAACRRSRLVTLTGPGGTGKTRLALSAARGVSEDFTDGVAFVDLTAVADPELAGVALAAAVGLEPGDPHALLDDLVVTLAQAHILLVVDNLEHLVGIAPVLSRLLDGAPGVHLLTTSRVPLGAIGEQVLRVPPLALTPRTDSIDGGPAESEAVRLFVQRARAVVPAFDPQGDELAATAEICVLLDGLPLAIELAAGRVRLHPPRSLLNLLRTRSATLGGGPRHLPQRQRALRDTLAWSEALLPVAERATLARLGVFKGSFDVAAAAAVSGRDLTSAAVTRQLRLLGEHSLLEDAPGHPARFRLLHVVRAYALERLEELGEETAARAAHLRHYLAAASRQRTGVAGPDLDHLPDQLDADLAEIDSALAWTAEDGGGTRGVLEDAIRLAVAVAPVWSSRPAPAAAGAAWLRRLLAVDDARPQVPAHLRSQAMLALRTWDGTGTVRRSPTA